MSRTRAERRFNTLVKTSRRKALAIRGEIDQFPAGGFCGGKVAPNGEACSCSRCETIKRMEEGFDYKALDQLRSNEWTRVNLTDYNTDYPS